LGRAAFQFRTLADLLNDAAERLEDHPDYREPVFRPGGA
jgi:hypothetical protein